jgi:hypothetical protein
MIATVRCANSGRAAILKPGFGGAKIVDIAWAKKSKI